jgi:hypothetical protein
MIYALHDSLTPGRELVQTKEGVSFCSCVNATVRKPSYGQLVRDLEEYAESHKPDYVHPAEIETVIQPCFRVHYEHKDDAGKTSKVAIDVAKSKEDFDRSILAMTKIADTAEKSRSEEIKKWINTLEEGRDTMSKPKSYCMQFTAKADSAMRVTNRDKDFATLVAIIPEAEDLLRILSKHRWTYSGKICTVFRLRKTKFDTTGAITLPYHVDLDPRTVRLIGQAEVRGLSIGFNESPLGMKSILVTALDDYLEVRIIFEYKSKSLEGLLRKNFDMVSIARSAFVGSRENDSS